MDFFSLFCLNLTSQNQTWLAKRQRKHAFAPYVVTHKLMGTDATCSTTSFNRNLTSCKPTIFKAICALEMKLMDSYNK
jgi:hypothetical protein